MLQADLDVMHHLPERSNPMRRMLRPSLVIPAVLSAALLATLLALGHVTTVVVIMLRFERNHLLYILLLLGTYEAVQYLQWHQLLRALSIYVPQRAQVFAFLLGSATKTLPIGNFFENYLLLRASCTDFGLSSSATLLSVLIEVAVSLAGLVLLGLDHWGWLRPLIVIGLTVFLVGAWVVYKRMQTEALPAWLSRHRSLRLAQAELRRFRLGAAALLHPRVLVRAVALGASYLLLGGSTLYVVARGLGIGRVSFGQVLAVYFFSLAFGLIFPLPVDIGVTEATGVGALLAIGVDRSVAISVMLIMRVLSVGISSIIALGAMLVMPDELRAVLREQPGRLHADGIERAEADPTTTS
jgi:uncharacterized membrane protein YbhN (UPF0104 family)